MNYLWFYLVIDRRCVAFCDASSPIMIYSIHYNSNNNMIDRHTERYCVVVVVVVIIIICGRITRFPSVYNSSGYFNKDDIGSAWITDFTSVRIRLIPASSGSRQGIYKGHRRRGRSIGITCCWRPGVGVRAVRRAPLSPRA